MADEHVQLSIFFIFRFDKALNSGFYVCKADSLLLELHSSLFALVIFGDGSS
jgi:hypothetical protein